MDECQCTGPGWCKRHGIVKHAQWVHLCQTNEKYRRNWDQSRGPGQVKPPPDGTPMKDRPKPHGPGTELKRLLKLFGLFSKGGCDCGKHAMVMDQWGPQRCREKMDSILGWLEDEARKRHLPFMRTAAMILVKRAIRNAEINAVTHNE